MAVLQQVEAGSVELDAPVRDSLPEFTLADGDAAARVTVRHLLNHTSGLADAGFPDLWRLDERRPAERVASLSRARPVTEPGVAYHYFNPNYEALARLVERASGQDFNDYLQRRVFDPLGMADTTSVNRAEQTELAAPGLAQGHIMVFGVPVAYDEPAGYVAGSAGIASTAADLARWLVLHANPDSFAGRRVLRPEGIRTMRTPPPGVDSTYGMGWWTATAGGHPVIEHNGVLATAYAELVLLPQTGHGIALLANANHAVNDVPRIKNGIVALLNGPPPPGAWITHRQLVALSAGLIVVGLVVRAHAVGRRHAWAQRRARGAAWRRSLGLARLLLPTVLLTLLPVLIAAATGRDFPHRLLALAAPELTTWLTLASATGLTLAATRARALIDVRRQAVVSEQAREPTA